MGSLTKFEKNELIFILCDCKSEILVIDYDKQSELADFAIYENFASYSNKMSFWQKVRYIWQIVIKNKPYCDQIILNKHQLKEIKGFIEQII